MADWEFPFWTPAFLIRDGVVPFVTTELLIFVYKHAKNKAINLIL